MYLFDSFILMRPNITQSLSAEFNVKYQFKVHQEPARTSTSMRKLKVAWNLRRECEYLCNAPVRVGRFRRTIRVSFSLPHAGHDAGHAANVHPNSTATPARPTHLTSSSTRLVGTPSRSTYSLPDDVFASHAGDGRSPLSGGVGKKSSGFDVMIR